MRDVYIIGAFTTRFGKCLDLGIKDLAGMALEGVLADAGLQKADIETAWFANSGWGMRSYQHAVRGQVALRKRGIEAIPITNVENACAGGSTALHGAYKDVAGGFAEVSLAIGAEKVYDRNRFAVFAGFLSGLDTEELGPMMDRLKEFAPPPGAGEASGPGKKPRPKRKAPPVRERLRSYRDMLAVFVQLGEALGYGQVRRMARLAGSDHSPFMDVYGYAARRHMEKYGSTPAQLAAIASKNHWHSSMNPNAQYTFEVSPEDVLADRMVSYPLTRSMCAPVGDGAAAAVVASAEAAERLGSMARAVKVEASVLASGRDREWDGEDIAVRASRRAYETSGIGPGDIGLAEVHDATAFGELHQTEALGFFDKGMGGVAAQEGATRLGGSLPVNTSGGLVSRGHPIGASGLAQVHEVVTQLRGEAGKRQVGGAKVGLAENGGGAVGNEEAAMCVHIFSK